MMLTKPSSTHPMLRLVEADNPFETKKPPEKKQSALLLEDDDFDAAITTELLEKRIKPNFTVTRVRTMTEAIQFVSELDFDVALLDLNLSDSSGLTTLREIQRANQELPIVVLTGDNRKETALKAIEIGAHEYLPKQQLNDKILERLIAFAALRHKTAHENMNRKNTDRLTGLPSSKAMSHEYLYMKRRAKNTGRNIGLILMDVKNFKGINDAYGHEVGDALLVHISQTIQASNKHRSLTTRLAGDEFVTLIEGVRTTKCLRAVKDRLALILSDCFEYQDNKIFYSAHVVSILESGQSQNDVLTALERLKIEMIKTKSLIDKQAS